MTMMGFFVPFVFVADRAIHANIDKSTVIFLNRPFEFQFNFKNYKKLKSFQKSSPFTQ
jgi:hypothetical protein